MFVSLRIILSVFTVSNCSLYAFDPFSIISVIGTGASIVSGLSDTASEVAGASGALGELYSEIDGDAEISPGANRTVAKLREVESLAKEVGYTKTEIETLLEQDNSDTKSLTRSIQKLTRAVQLGKKVANLLSRLDKKAQAAQVESAAIEREQLKVQYKSLNEQIDHKLNEKKEKLQAALEKKNAVKLHTREIAKRGGRVFGQTGIYTFPKIDNVVAKSVTITQKMTPIFAGLVLLAFLVRLIYYQFELAGSNKYGDLVRDVIVCFLLLAVYPQIIHAALGISHGIAEKISFGSTETLRTPSTFPSLRIGEMSQSLALTLVWLGSWFKYIAFVLADFVFNFGLAFLVLLFPLVIFVSQMLNFSLAWPLFLASFLILSLWPVFWNATGMLASELWVMNSQSLMDDLKTLLFTALQLVSPLVCMLVLKGQSVGQAVGGSVQRAAKFAGGAFNHASGVAAGSMGRRGGSVAGRMAGHALSYPVRQMSSRVMAAQSTSRAAFREHAPSSPVSKSRLTASTGLKVLSAGASGFLLNERAIPKNRAGTQSAAQFVRGFRPQNRMKGRRIG